MFVWRAQLNHDPLPALLSCEYPAVHYFARRDLLDEQNGPVNELWDLPEAGRILKKQLANGCWARPGEGKYPAINYALIETWRFFRILVEKYGFTRQHPQAHQAAEFLFTCQTKEGDFRGFLANQYATYYSGAIMALLIQAGYGGDAAHRERLPMAAGHAPGRSGLDHPPDHTQAGSPDPISPDQRVRSAART